MTDDAPAPYDPDAETVAQEWEGEVIFESWGYNQTNVDLAEIVDVSDSGKTVVARRVSAAVAERGSGSETLTPDGDPHGDEFRLHVRASDSGVYFRGSYPYITGREDDGTRMGTFLPYGDRDGVHQTDAHHRH